jgi:hypothetical protein
LKRKELITLSRVEHDRCLIIRKVMKREMSQVEAADLLNISDRYVRPLTEKLWERERIRISDEKLRQIMIKEGIWRARQRRGRSISGGRGSTFAENWCRWTALPMPGSRSAARSWC